MAHLILRVIIVDECLAAAGQHPQRQPVSDSSNARRYAADEMRRSRPRRQSEACGRERRRWATRFKRDRPVEADGELELALLAERVAERQHALARLGVDADERGKAMIATGKLRLVRLY